MSAKPSPSYSRSRWVPSCVKPHASAVPPHRRVVGQRLQFQAPQVAVAEAVLAEQPDHLGPVPLAARLGEQRDAEVGVPVEGVDAPQRAAAQERAVGHGLGQQRHHSLAVGRLGDLLLQPGADLADVAWQERLVVGDQVQLGIAVQTEHIRRVIGRGRAQSDPVGGEHAATLTAGAVTIYRIDPGYPDDAACYTSPG